MNGMNRQRYDDDGMHRLPTECWELIINRIKSYHYLEDLSLACKEFLSITNKARRTLRIFNKEIVPLFSKLIRRFSKLKSIHLEGIDGGELTDLLHQIADSGLNLQELSITSSSSPFYKLLPDQLSAALKHLGSNMNCLKIFKCTGWENFCDEYLFSIADSMPLLEELDIGSDSFGTSVSKNGMKTIAWKHNLKKLRRLDISGHRQITCRCLCKYFSYLSLNKLSLLHSLWDINFDFVFRNYPDLVSLKLGKIPLPINIESLAFARSLQELEFYSIVFSYESCSSIAQARLPLRKFVLSNCQFWSFGSFFSLLASYPSLESLQLENNLLGFCIGGVENKMSDLYQKFRNLRYLNLVGGDDNVCRGCGNVLITSSTFYTLANNCPLLTVLEMKRMGLAKQQASSSINNSTIDVEGSVKSHDHIQFLNLSMNEFLDDELLEKLTLICPNLEFLHVAGCPKLTEGGISKVLNYSSKRKILKKWFSNMECSWRVHISSTL
ncbi:F-box/LRR-repeat protein [Quillaja saponaria]|uniref:F-box/LRR-repeat protein n=1 Tax=Quillaja saponaria TaxID=32244 RepID=A0AAD7QA03_QUISA|nr:F-box/LRR-repeat protein [Quillaja saponaria]